MFCLQSKYLDNKVNCRVQTIYRKFRHFKVEEFVGKKYLQTFSMSFPALYYVCMYVYMELQYYFTRPVVCGAQWNQSLSMQCSHYNSYVY